MLIHSCCIYRLVAILAVGLEYTVAAKSYLDLTKPATNRTTTADTPSKILHRDKRYLLWAGGGVSKSVLGLLAPVETRDHVNWRTLNMGYNFQAQYVPVPSIIYPWTRFEREMHDARRLHDDRPDAAPPANDGTRQFVYTVYETIVGRRGGHGRQCLQRAICEAAQTPIERVGVFDEMLQLFLTPRAHEVSEVYTEAMQAGARGVDCLSLYAQCPMGWSILDGISFFKG